MIVRVPASSANLGPGFDALGMALSLHAEFGVDDGRPLPEKAVLVDEHHPAFVAFTRFGGVGHLWVRSPIPMARGLGFSGAMRVGAAVAAAAQQCDDPVHERTSEVLALASELEGHADNAAASLLGGVVAVSGGAAVRVPLSFDPAVVVWVPSAGTSTDKSRAVLPQTVTFADAVLNVGSTALLVAALAAGDTDALRTAVQDRLHQDVRLAQRPDARAALDAGLSAGAWCGWLSGSGPTVAFLVPIDAAEDLAAALPDDGHAKVLRIDHAGTTVERTDDALV